MKKSLYDSFSRWREHGQLWFYSDPHFGDEEMKYIRRDYIGDDEQVARINKVVGKNDTIVFLGDIGDVSYISKIRGYKVLVMGNHDVGASRYRRSIGAEDNHLFDEVYEGPVFISEKILLSHEPISFYYALNIHGHDHSGWQFQDGAHLNVCAENINYTPVAFTKIVKEGRLKVETLHRATIENASKKL